MIVKKLKTALFISCVFLTIQSYSQNKQLFSPDKNIKVVFSTGNHLSSIVSYDLLNNGDTIVHNAHIALDLKGLSANNFLVYKIKTQTIHSLWRAVYGERKNIPDNYQQVIFSFKSAGDPGLKLEVTSRVYDEGFAFQYRLFLKGKTILLNQESSTFPLTQHAIAWVSDRAQSPLSRKNINDITGLVERPLTVKSSDHHWIALGESSLTDFARMKFTCNGENTIISRLSGTVTAKDSLISPWRYILIGKNPGDLLEKNYLLLNLNAPNQVADVCWIHPGKVLRETTLTTAGSYLAIDFAEKHHIRYICFDAGWYGREDSDTANATRVCVDPARSKGPLDLKKVIEYGKEKNVGVILYVNRHALERQLDTLLPLYHSWGIKGIKFGFVQVGSQKWTNWLHEAVRKAARFKLLLDVHDEYRPTGYSRTYPNLLTQEGVRGDEESPYTEHTITTLFTRSLAGAADNTICYFTGRVAKMGSHVAQMAKSVCIYSPLQFLFWYDRPVADSQVTGGEGEIQEVPELSWFDALPTVWDDTKVLEGNMENFATIARRSGNSWFIGSLNGTTARTVNWSLEFLDKNKKYRAVIYTDCNSIPSATHVKITEKVVGWHSRLTMNIAARNGIAVHLSPL